MPVAAPISPAFTKWWPRPSSAMRSGVARNAGSAPVLRAFRWLARGSAIACGRHAEIDAIEEHLKHGRDDRRAAR